MSRRILIACEFSGRVRNAFRLRGYDAWSADVVRSHKPGPHYQGDVRDILNDGWDMMIAHPPCKHLCISGRAHWAKKQELQKEAIAFVRELMNAPIPHIAIENSVGILSTVIRKPDQVVHPYQFGDPYPKATCWWLKNLPLLEETDVVDVPPDMEKHIYRMSRKDSYRTSITPQGMAKAMADQWGPWSHIQRELFEVSA